MSSAGGTSGAKRRLSVLNGGGEEDASSAKPPRKLSKLDLTGQLSLLYDFIRKSKKVEGEKVVGELAEFCIRLPKRRNRSRILQRRLQTHRFTQNTTKD